MAAIATAAGAKQQYTSKWVSYAYQREGDPDDQCTVNQLAAKMTASPDAKTFAVVTERIENQGVAFRDLAKQIASVDSLQAFMAEFKTQGATKLANK